MATLATTHVVDLQRLISYDGCSLQVQLDNKGLVMKLKQAYNTIVNASDQAFVLRRVRAISLG